MHGAFTGAQVAKDEIDADVDNVGVKQTAVPCDRVEYADMATKIVAAANASCIFLLGTEKEQTEDHQRQRSILHPNRRH